MKLVVIQPGHNATVGYFEDGVCVYVFHEEKFTRIKNFTGFPMQALAHLFKRIDHQKIHKIIITDIYLHPVSVPKATFAFTKSLRKKPLFKAYKRLLDIPYLSNFFTSFMDIFIKYVVAPDARKKMVAWLYETYRIEDGRIQFTDHHLNHCLSPFYFYGLADKKEDFLLMSLDGVGDFSCSKIYKYSHKRKKFTKIADTYYTASIGLLYKEVTKYLGMTPNEHEYKVMGLAAYVDNEKYYRRVYEQMKPLIGLDKKSLTFYSRFNIDRTRFFLQKHAKFERFDNVAKAAQRIVEELVTEWIQAAIKKTGIRNIAVAGGVFMNVKMNEKIVQLPEVKSVYFQPSAGDESLHVGAAANSFIAGKIPLKPIKSMFGGHEYSNDEVKQFLAKYAKKYTITYHDDIEKKIANLLARFEIVARFTGKGEWGARSLCNRAILANASDLKSFHEVNDMIKMRDFWMPFAPTMLASWAPKYVQNWNLIKKKAYDSTKYMILTCQSTKLGQEHLRAAIHQKDKTLRPQVVGREDGNESLYRLLRYYEKETGMGGLMNTSLNIHGYPLVGTLEDAMFTFENSGLRHIALENYLVSKK